MDFENFTELVKTRRSCRSFNDKPLDKETVYRIADLARLAPSACNSQPWKMYCVTDEARVEKVREALSEGGMNSFLSGAKAFIAAAETSPSDLKANVAKRFSTDRFVKYDVGELVAYLTLGAKSAGVESCIIGWVNEGKLRSALDLPEGESCAVVVALGYSDTPVPQKIRKAESETIVRM